MDKFWRKVKKADGDACWDWQGSCTTGGYGQFCYDTVHHYTHRLAYELTFGPIPDRNENGEKIFVCHKCDNRRCARPDHLFLGTCADNNWDKVRKGRDNSPRGSKSPSAKLTEANVREIRWLLTQGLFSQNQIGKEFGVTRWIIQSIVKGETWSHVQ